MKILQSSFKQMFFFSFNQIICFGLIQYQFTSQMLPSYTRLLCSLNCTSRCRHIKSYLSTALSIQSTLLMQSELNTYILRMQNCYQRKLLVHCVSKKVRTFKLSVTVEWVL